MHHFGNAASVWIIIIIKTNVNVVFFFPCHKHTQIRVHECVHSTFHTSRAVVEFYNVYSTWYKHKSAWRIIFSRSLISVSCTCFPCISFLCGRTSRSRMAPYCACKVPPIVYIFVCTPPWHSCATQSHTHKAYERSRSLIRRRLYSAGILSAHRPVYGLQKFFDIFFFLIFCCCCFVQDTCNILLLLLLVVLLLLEIHSPFFALRTSIHTYRHAVLKRLYVRCSKFFAYMRPYVQSVKWLRLYWTYIFAAPCVEENSLQ